MGWRCFFHGHEKLFIDGKNSILIHQKGGSQQACYLFDGVYVHCLRCPWTDYIGKRYPVEIFAASELEISEDGTITRRQNHDV